jgi:hypothetical protein
MREKELGSKDISGMSKMKNRYHLQTGARV